MFLHFLDTAAYEAQTLTRHVDTADVKIIEH